jgi:molybdopterin molybdotransferase
VSRFHFRDVRHEIEHLLWHIIAEYDVVIISGGVSKGKFDYLPAELERQGVQKIFQGVAQRPGKPLWFGVSARQTPVFALPGNPVSTYTCLHRYVLPALAQAGGERARAPRLALLDRAIAGRPKLTQFLPVRLSSGPRAELIATPDPSNTSGDFGGLLGTDGFVELTTDKTEVAAGSLAPFWPWV